MKISYTDFSIRSACIVSLFISALCVLTLIGSSSHCDGDMIALAFVLQVFGLGLFAALPYAILRFAKKGLPPSPVRRKLIYAALVGLAFEILRGVYLDLFLGHTASCI
jgi:hypothetical protein